ncbi:MAG: ABC transporter permease [Gemmatimonadota bacterium]|nr:ABC transporter permease [Gemmatimonadota bacterium]
MRLPEGFRRTPPPDWVSDGDDIEEEIRFHIESRTRELVAEGLDASEARRRACAEFGDRDRAVRRARRESRGWGRMTMGIARWMAEAGRDLVVAVRQVRSSPGLFVAALLTLALGVGGTTAMYSVVHGVLLQPLPYPDEERVVRIWPAAPGDPDGGRQSWSIPDMRDWRERSESLTAIGAYSTELGGLVVADGGGSPEEVPTAYVTPGFFEALGTPPALGAALPAEAEETEPRVVVLSDGYWRRRFGADPSVIGGTLETQQGGYRIAGVMPPGFAFPSPETELWTFLANVSQSSVPWRLRQVRVFEGVARVAAGPGGAPTDLAAAEEELGSVARSLARDVPDTNEGITSVELMPVREAIVGDVRTPLALVAGAIVLTLLIACANVANLLLARGVMRRREFELRASLGAGRGRLVRQVLVESLFLSISGGLVGAGLAVLAVPVLVSGADGLLPRAEAISVDGGMLLVALAAAVGTGLLVGLLPALRVGGTGLGSGRGTAGAGAGEARGVLGGLVFAEVGLAVVLLVGGGLLMRSFAELTAIDPGFEPDGLLVADMVVSGYEEADAYLGFRDRLLAELEAIPGVTGATTAKEFPTRGTGERMSWALPGDPPPVPGEERTAQLLNVHHDFFEVMEIPVLRGTLPEGDPELALVVNERLAREAFGSAADAVDATLRVGEYDVPVRAVVGDVLHTDPAEPPPPMAYIDDRVNARRVFSFIVRVDGDPVSFVAPLRRAVEEVDERQPVRSVYTAGSAYADAVAQPRFFAFVMTLFAAGATLLAVVGIYGVVAYSVRRRTHEIGVRVALGADLAGVQRLVVSRALKPVVLGLGVGLLGAAALSSLLRGMLFGVPALDLPTYAGVGLLFLAVAVLASWVPARAAARVDPKEALQAE